MNRRDYIKLATAIATIEKGGERRRTAKLIGDVCKNDNPLFDFVRWNKACKAEPKTRVEEIEDALADEDEGWSGACPTCGSTYTPRADRTVRS